MRQEYSHINASKNHSYEGVSFSISEIENAFSTSVKNTLLDVEGTSELVTEFTDEFDDLKTTDFEDTYLLDIFRLDDIIDENNPWRVGEAFAEYYIEETTTAKFYYNELRDARNILGNKTGADLLGFIEVSGEILFLFGEVKTSNQDKSPPQVLYGRTGMIDQLKNLADNRKTQKQLIRNFGFKVKDLDTDNPFRKDFLQALIHFNSNKLHLFGVLVRDTKPNEDDLRSRFKNLTKSIIEQTNLKLIALYVPVKMEDWNKIVNK